MFRKTDEGLRWVVPKTARRYITSVNHDLYVKRYISSCFGYLYNKEPAGKRPGYLHPIEKVATPMHTLHVDHLSPTTKSKRKNSYLIVAVDSFTKYTYMKAVPNTKELHVERFLDEKVVQTFGVPKRIIIDRGACLPLRNFRNCVRSLV